MTAPPAAGFVAALRDRDFAALYAAEAQSVAGDQLGRVALSVLVFERTGSSAATAGTYAATYLPAIVGGTLAARLGDRLARRPVMVGSDLIRAALFAAMALPMLPIPAVVGLLVAAIMIGPVFSAAEVSHLASRLDDDRFRAATGLRLTTAQAAQVVGFAVGGVLVEVLHPRGALLVDAATYLVSALLIGRVVSRGAPPERRGSAAEPDRRAGRAAALLWRDRRLRGLVGLSLLAGCFTAPEGLAVPFAASLHVSAAGVGLLLAMLPAGGAVGAVVLVRAVRPALRGRAMQAMATVCGLPLVVPWFVPSLGVALVCWFVSGALAAFQVEVLTAAVRRLPETSRSQLIGLVGAGLLGAQGLGLAAFGGLAGATGAAAAIAAAGLAGSAAAVAIVRLWGPGRPRPNRPGSARGDAADRRNGPARRPATRPATVRR